MKRILGVACLFTAFTGLMLAKPPTLDEFWKQWREHNLSLMTKDGERFVRSCAQQWNPSMIPAMIHDAQACRRDEAEERDYVYTLAVLYIPDRKGCKDVIARIRASPHVRDQKIGDWDTTDDIAYDFESAINDIETGQEKLPDLN